MNDKYEKLMLYKIQEPKTFEEMNVHTALNQKLIRMSEWSDSPHLLFYGPPGSGKRTRIMALLRKQFGEEVMNSSSSIEETYQTEANKKSITVTIVKSLIHVEIDMRNYPYNNKKVVSAVLKSMAKQQGLETTMNKTGIKNLILLNADYLSKDAQQSLRRMMEKYANYCRIILCTRSTDSLIQPIRSRCLCVRVPQASRLELLNLLEYDASFLHTQTKNEMVDACGGNMKKLFLLLEACLLSKVIAKSAKWESSIDSILEKLDQVKKHTISEQTKFVSDVREDLYNMLVQEIPPPLIVKVLTERLLEHFSQNRDMQMKIAFWASKFEHRIHLSDKPVFHIEPFIVKILLAKAP